MQFSEEMSHVLISSTHGALARTDSACSDVPKRFDVEMGTLAPPASQNTTPDSKPDDALEMVVDTFVLDTETLAMDWACSTASTLGITRYPKLARSRGRLLS